MTYLNVNEVFGPTIQGEGINAGKLCAFIRLSGCNLACSWCDTPYSWDWNRFDKKVESHKWAVEDLTQTLDDFAVERIIVTGGEPMLQQRALVELIHSLPMCDFEIETNGTIAPTAEMINCASLFVVSPKLAHSGDKQDVRLNESALSSFSHRAWDGQAIFKFVAQAESDLEQVQEIVQKFRIPRETVWIMPEGYERETHLKNLEAIADAVVAKGWNLTTRLHLLAWGTKRGV